MAFNLKTHYRDPKTGEIIKKDPYRMRVSAEDGVRFFRGGKEYFADGTPVHKEPSLAQVQKAPEPPKVEASKTAVDVAPKPSSKIKHQLKPEEQAELSKITNS